MNYPIMEEVQIKKNYGMKKKKKGNPFSSDSDSDRDGGSDDKREDDPQEYSLIKSDPGRNRITGDEL
jgi:hypothetical protein